MDYADASPTPLKLGDESYLLNQKREYLSEIFEKREKKEVSG